MQGFRNTLRTMWDDGLYLRTEGREVNLRVRGRLNLDVNGYVPSDAIEAAFGGDEARIFVRRVRLSLAGPVTKRIDFKLELDFTDREITFTDAYLRRQGVPYVGSITLGKFKVPFGLDFLTSGLGIPLQERALTQAFVPGREIGLRVGTPLLGSRLTWALSATSVTESDDSLEVSGDVGDLNLTFRLTGLPRFANDGRELIHLGFAYSFRALQDDDIRFRTRPEAFLKDDQRFVDTRTLAANTAHYFGVEAAMVRGPWSLQGEVMLALLLSGDAAVDGTTYSAFYVLMSYILSGEHRSYNVANAAFGRLRPAHTILDGGLGAWEVAARVSSVDLHDAFGLGSISTSTGRQTGGGKELNLPLGVNWYPHTHLRVTLNYVRALVDRDVIETDDAGNVVRVIALENDPANILMLRFQVDF